MNWYKKAQLTDEWDDYENPGEYPILINYSYGDPPAPEFITTTIKQLIKEFGCTPYQINNGGCDSFGEGLIDKIPGARLYETNFYNPNWPTHLFVQVGSLFFDAEHPEGVSDWKQLNIYRKFLKKKK